MKRHRRRLALLLLAVAAVVLVAGCANVVNNARAACHAAGKTQYPVSEYWQPAPDGNDYLWERCSGGAVELVVRGNGGN